MRRVRVLGILLLLACLTSCATIGINASQITPKRAYYEAQVAYLNAWESYHKIWLALPDTDQRKADWAFTYHPKFLTAGELLAAWGKSPSDGTQGGAVNVAIDQLEDILIQLAISKGGGK